MRNELHCPPISTFRGGKHTGPTYVCEHIAWPQFCTWLEALNPATGMSLLDVAYPSSPASCLRSPTSFISEHRQKCQLKGTPLYVQIGNESLPGRHNSSSLALYHPRRSESSSVVISTNRSLSQLHSMPDCRYSQHRVAAPRKEECSTTAQMQVDVAISTFGRCAS